MVIHRLLVLVGPSGPLRLPSAVGRNVPLRRQATKLSLSIIVRVAPSLLPVASSWADTIVPEIALIVLVVLTMLPCYGPRAAAVVLQSSALAISQSRHGPAARAPEGALSGRSHSSYLWVRRLTTTSKDFIF